MSIKTTRQERLDYLVRLSYNLGSAMSEKKWRIAQDFVATCILGVIALLALNDGETLVSANATFWIGVINTVSLAELAKAYKETKAQQREQLNDDA